LNGVTIVVEEGFPFTSIEPLEELILMMGAESRLTVAAPVEEHPLESTVFTVWETAAVVDMLEVVAPDGLQVKELNCPAFATATLPDIPGQKSVDITLGEEDLFIVVLMDKSVSNSQRLIVAMTCADAELPDMSFHWISTFDVPCPELMDPNSAGTTDQKISASGCSVEIENDEDVFAQGDPPEMMLVDGSMVISLTTRSSGFEKQYGDDVVT
jgi:hypothetical protein